MKCIGIVGSRRRNTDNDFELCYATFLNIYKKGDTLVSGGCKQGGDRFCEILAKKYNIPIKIHYADWTHYGKGAGFIRNEFIVKDSDILIALVSKDRTGGTENTIDWAKKYNKKVIIVE
jgi:hypothetical protein